MKPSEVHSSESVVLILGAGASCAHNLPVMSQFLSVARRRLFDHYRNSPDYEESWRPLDQLLQFHQECRQSAWLFNRDWDNIEELYTQADLCRIAGMPSTDEAKALCEDIAWAIWDIYRTDNETGSELPKVLQMVRRASLFPKIITTNYDVVVERVVGNAHDPAWRDTVYYPGFVTPDSRRVTTFNPFVGHEAVKERNPSGEPNGVPLIKLHGSVNWFNTPSNCYAYFDQGLAQSPSEARPSHSTISDRDLKRSKLVGELRYAVSQTDSIETSITPAIIPPMLGKSSNDPVIAYQWNAAINVLRRARQVWIVGYSFPPTDSFMPRLLCEGLYDNSDLDFVAIVNRETPEAFESRMRTIFNPTLPSTKLKYFQIDAQEWFRELGGMSTWSKCVRVSESSSSKWRLHNGFTEVRI